MKIAVLGKGNVGGGLADRWERAGHEVTRIGRGGGDVSDAEVVLLAVPNAAIADAVGVVTGIEGKTVVDATNQVRGERPPGFESLAEYVKSLTNGPVAKSFNANFASLHDEIDVQGRKPSNVYASDEEAREVTEQLIRDAGYDPVRVGDLSAARAVENFLAILFGAYQEGGAPVFYRIAPPGAL